MAKDPHQRLTDIQQAPGNYVMILPEDQAQYRMAVEAFIKESHGAHPKSATTWIGVPKAIEENQAAVRYVANEAGKAISPLGSIDSMRIEEGTAYVQLEAHLEASALEIAIAEPIVRETLVAFDMIDRVEFTP